MSILFYNRKFKQKSRDLRKNMTNAEKVLWKKFRRRQILGTQWFRQRSIGDFIVDFYYPTAKFIIEVDGGQHFEEEGRLADKARDEEIAHLGFQVLRFTNREVLDNIDGVLRKIIEEIQKSLPTSLLKREE